MLHKRFLGRNFLAGLSGALLLAAAPSVQADVVALYPFTNSSLASTDTNTQSTASAITLGSGLTDAATSRFATIGNPAPALRVNTDETGGDAFATAITAGDYFTFTLAPASGYRFVFQSFSVDLATSATTFTTNVRLQASINGSAFVNVDSVTGFSNTTFTAQTFDLTFGNGNAAIQGGAAVLLRVVVFDNANNADNYTAFDNITVNATLQAIPEPGTTTLVAFSAATAGGLILRRRKR